MNRIRAFGAAALSLVAVSLVFSACETGPGAAGAGRSSPPRATNVEHGLAVMRSSFCADCHPEIYAEHAQNTHGRAFTDEEVRLATGRFSQADCIICHTPRPIFETGIGMNPKRRHYGLEEGNSCMTCHWKAGYDYGSFQGGKECKAAFDDRVGKVEACASCHRNHGTPFQWERAVNGKASGRECVDCHMQTVVRPVAVGEPPKKVKSHVFPGSRSESQIQKAYSYTAAISGNEVVVTVKNKGAGHNFPTELKQRSVESLIVVRDLEGKEIGRSRLVFRDPYKRPYGLELPVNTQIPSGETREHRVPLKVAAGSVDCELHFKLYYPIEDHHPALARRLESRKLVFTDVTPSDKVFESEPDLKIVTPEGIAPEIASPAELVDFARPKIGAVKVDVPKGNTDADIDRLIELFQFPVPQANGEARKRLIEIGLPAVPKVVKALGSWDNKTFNQAMAVLEALGEKSGPALVAALGHQELYVRIHARELLGRMSYKGAASGKQSEVYQGLVKGLAMASALDRSTAAQALGVLGFVDAVPEITKLLGDGDPDVVRAAALALGNLDARGSTADLRKALAAASFDETRRDVALALGKLGDSSGVPFLIAGLDHRDDLVRESMFEAFFAIVPVHLCYDPLLPQDERLEALARLSAWWGKEGGDKALRVRRIETGYKVDTEVWKLVNAFAGGDGSTPPGDDDKIRARLLELGERAVPMLVQGFKYPAGFAGKRAKICGVLREIGSKYAVPGLVATLRDPVVGVAAWACAALEACGDPSALPALERYHSRLLSLAAAGKFPESAGDPQLIVAQAAACRLALGDSSVVPDLAGALLAASVDVRKAAIAALQKKFGDARGYDAEADPKARAAAAAAWVK